MSKRVYGAQMTLAMGEGSDNLLTSELIRKEFADMAEFFINGGAVGNVGPITSVVGLRFVVSYALSVDAPELTWAELEEKTKSMSEPEPVPKAKGKVREINDRKRRG